jgi:hypothetical protein
MLRMAEQNYASHRRFLPAYHFFVIPVLFANVIYSVVAAFRWPSKVWVWQVIVSIALLTFGFIARINALRVQDRLIRLEEQLRLQRLLPADMQNRIGELRPSQLIAMRFCHDDEVCDLARAILAGEVKTADEIKRRIKTWRPDWLRV